VCLARTEMSGQSCHVRLPKCRRDDRDDSAADQVVHLPADLRRQGCADAQDAVLPVDDDGGAVAVHGGGHVEVDLAHGVVQLLGEVFGVGSWPRHRRLPGQGADDLLGGPVTHSDYLRQRRVRQQLPVRSQPVHLVQDVLQRREVLRRLRPDRDLEVKDRWDVLQPCRVPRRKRAARLRARALPGQCRSKGAAHGEPGLVCGGEVAGVKVAAGAEQGQLAKQRVVHLRGGEPQRRREADHGNRPAPRRGPRRGGQVIVTPGVQQRIDVGLEGLLGLVGQSVQGEPHDLAGVRPGDAVLMRDGRDEPKPTSGAGLGPVAARDRDDRTAVLDLDTEQLVIAADPHRHLGVGVQQRVRNELGQRQLGGVAPVGTAAVLHNCAQQPARGGWAAGVRRERETPLEAGPGHRTSRR